MQHRTRCQCPECRKAFVPNASARKTQKTCSRKVCRDKRRRRQARRRRRSNLAAYRVDERDRQRRRRARLKEGHEYAPAREGKVGGEERQAPTWSPRDALDFGHAPVSCHAPASAPNHADFQEKLANCLAAVLELSRAGLGPDLPRFLRKIERSRCNEAQGVKRVSRATLGAEVDESTGERGSKSAPLSRTGLPVRDSDVLSGRRP